MEVALLVRDGRHVGGLRIFGDAEDAGAAQPLSVGFEHDVSDDLAALQTTADAATDRTDPASSVRAHSGANAAAARVGQRLASQSFVGGGHRGELMRQWAE